MEITYLEYEEPSEYEYMSVRELAYDIDDYTYHKEPLIWLYDMYDNELLKIKRIADGFNQTELSNILGMGISTLSEIETGRRATPKIHLERIKSYMYDEVYEDKKFKEYYEY